jgi:hypothetical protein
MLNPEPETRKRCGHRFGEDFGRFIERDTRGSPDTPSARDFCNTSWFARPLANDGPFASYEALPGSNTTAAAETKTGVAKKEEYNGRLQKSR